jgi:hypothetical protein
MADLGAYGIVKTSKIKGAPNSGLKPVGTVITVSESNNHIESSAAGLHPSGGKVSVRGMDYFTGFTQDDTLGTPTAPSLKVVGNSYQRKYLWPISAGLQSISIDVMKNVDVVNFEPSLTIKKNTDLGVSADITQKAPTGTGWVTIGPINVFTTAAGVLELIISVPYAGLVNGEIVQTNIDNLKSTLLSDKFLSWSNGVPVMNVGTSAVTLNNEPHHAWGTPVFGDGSQLIP